MEQQDITDITNTTMEQQDITDVPTAMCGGCEPEEVIEDIGSTEPAKSESPEDEPVSDLTQEQVGEGEGDKGTVENEEPMMHEESPESDPVADEKAVDLNENGQPPQEGSEEEEDSVGDDGVKVEAIQKKEPEPTPVIETSASKGKEQKKQKKESKSKSKSKDKRKEDKSIEHVLKALSSLSSPEEKLAALCKKYTELLEEHKSVQAMSKQSQKQVTGLMREKEQLQMDHSKSLLAKSKMENLCRELQKHNKLIKEESLARVKDEEEKRREVANRFQTTITDIQSQMQDNYSKNTKLREENIELATRLKDLVGNYEKAQSQVEKVFNQNLALTQEKEKDTKEKQLLFLELEQSQKKIELLQCTEQQLRTQLALYTEKYEDFQSTLQKSNDVFNTFKGEMDKMSKKIKKLEKETAVWKTRCENSNKKCLEMAEEKQRRDQEFVKQQTKIQKLEKLCRALQAERNLLKSDSERRSSSRDASPSDTADNPSPAPEDTNNQSVDPASELKVEERRAEEEGAAECENQDSTAEQTEIEQSSAKTDEKDSDSPSISTVTADEKPELVANVPAGDDNPDVASTTDAVTTAAVSTGDQVPSSDSVTSVATSDGEGTVSDVD